MTSKLLITYDYAIPQIATEGIYVDWKEEIKKRYLEALNKELKKRSLDELCDLEQNEYRVLVKMRVLFQTGEYSDNDF